VGFGLFFNEGMAKLGVQRICAFSAQVSYMCDDGLMPDDIEELSQIGRAATVALYRAGMQTVSFARPRPLREPES
jgi:hypothetical protein